MWENDLEYIKKAIYSASGISKEYIIDHIDMMIKPKTSTKYQDVLDSLMQYYNSTQFIEEKPKTKLTISNLEKISKLDSRIQMRENPDKGDEYYILWMDNTNNYKCILSRYECKKGYYNLIGECRTSKNQIIKEISIRDIKDIDTFMNEIYNFIWEIMTK